ncbi:DUF6801 domain-containing protein [Amycolatopsis sp. H20-H5]|uniref:DUF6801 domain-containing protein n=1 Tax=Amycolatopsis sp. H20-H5 TaxID=3046309 RepID=UPI002DBA6524|nr:DUF6801 domain-containing protein [Amycolatopsis sp. H20-H5]MEC3978410.1 DUF6801 domain-containing protein [Amycolatopsis sp. H20-H5]
MNLRTPVRAVLAAGTVGLVVVAGLLLSGGQSLAAPTPIDKHLTFTCPFPLIGLQKLDVGIKANFDVPTAVGGSLKTSDLTVLVTVPDKPARGLNLVQAATIEGTASAGATITNGPAKPLALKIPMNVAKTDIPTTGTFAPVATGSVPTAVLKNPGKTSVVIGDFSTRLTPKKADGSPTGLGSFTSDCVLDPGQDPTLIAFDLAGAPPGDTAFAYGFKGSTALKSLGSTAPITGAFAAKVDLATKTFTGDLKVDPTHTDFKLFGFLPGSADITVVQNGVQAGQLTGTGFVSHTRFDVFLPLVSLFGLPISSDPKCGTVTPSSVDLVTAAGFDLLKGGKLTGTYSLSAFANCGALNDYISAFAKSEGNTLELDLLKQ